MAKIYEALEGENFKITHSEEYAAYIAALCKLSSHYVSPIRVKFAERAFAKYADPAVRKLVLAYGEEAEDLEKDRLREFKWASEYGATSDESMNDSCLNHAKSYGDAIFLLFGIKDDDKEEEKKEG